MKTPNCKHYTGYRPCFPYKVCTAPSDDCNIFDAQRLVIDLSENGALLNDPAQLAELSNHHPHSQIVAVVNPKVMPLYKAHPHVDLVFPFDFETVSILNLMRFDHVLVLESDVQGMKLSGVLAAVPEKRILLSNGELVLKTKPPSAVEPNLKSSRILIVNLDALGDVLMTTALLPAIKRAWSASTIDWVTVPYAQNVLKHNPMIETIIPYTEESVAELPDATYDLLISVDKGRRSCALAELINAPDKRGYGLNKWGHITCFNKDAEYAYRLGIDDHEKFRVNQKTGQQLLAESVGLKWQRDPYTLILTDEEKNFVKNYRASLGLTPEKAAIAFNTGCSDIYPNKKMTVDQHVKLIKRIGEEIPNAVVLLVGGKQETERNAEIARLCRAQKVLCPVIETPTTEGLRKGILYIDACDAMVTGDTSALHIGVGLGKFIVSWYGLSCWTEIDLYDNGVKFFPEGLDCAPCWKRECQRLNPRTRLPECLSRLDLEALLQALQTWARERKS